MPMMRSVSITIAAAALAVSAAHVQAQRPARRAPGQAANGSSMQIAIHVGADSLTYSGPGTCQFTKQASIYGLPAAMYSARGSGDAGSVNLTLWQPAGGAPDMLTLGITMKGTSHRVSTVKVGQQGSVQGSGKATIARSGAGGTFTLDATADSGRRITGTIACTSFTEPIAEGGD